MAVSNIYGRVENMYWDVTHFRYNTLLAKTLYIWVTGRFHHRQNTVAMSFDHIINREIALFLQNEFAKSRV